MKVYFSCSITGGRSEETTYQTLVRSMLANGYEVPTAHLSESNILEIEKVVEPDQIFERDMKWLRECDVVVAEVTSPSHGVGYEIAYALALGKPVLCVHQQGKKISMIISGNTNPLLVNKAYATGEEAAALVNAFLLQESEKRQLKTKKRRTGNLFVDTYRFFSGLRIRENIVRFLTTPNNALGIVLVALNLTVFGQYALRLSRYWIGIVCILIGIGLLFVTWKDTLAPDIKMGDPVKKFQKRYVPVSILGVLIVIAASVRSLQEVNNVQTGLWIAGLWLLGMVLFSLGVLLAFRNRNQGITSILDKLIENKVEILWVGLITLAGFALRMVNLESIPFSVSNDETKLAVESLHFLRGDINNFFVVTGDAYPVLSFIPESVSILLFGNTVFAMRLVSAIQGSLTILFLYLLAKEMFGKRIAFLSAGVLLALPVHMHFSRLGLNNILMGLHATLIFWLLLRAFRLGKPGTYLWAGLITGSALYAYSGSRLVMVLAVFLVVLECLFKRNYFRSNWLNLLIFLGGIFVMALPELGFFIKDPAQMNARLNSVSIFKNDWLPYQIQNNGTTLVAVLISQFLNALSIITTNGEFNIFYYSPYPFFNLFAAVFLMIGVGYSIRHIRRPLYIFLLVAFFLVIIVGGALIVPPPGSQRYLILLPIASILVALGIDSVIQTLVKTGVFKVRIGAWMSGILVALFSIYGIFQYFYAYRLGGHFLGLVEELEASSINIQWELGMDYQYVLVGDPWVFLNFGDYRFLLEGYDRIEIPRDKNILDIVELPASGEKPESIMPSFFVATPDRGESLEEVYAAYPGGQRFVAYRHFLQDQIMYYGYIYPPTDVELPENVVLIED